MSVRLRLAAQFLAGQKPMGLIMWVRLPPSALMIEQENIYRKRAQQVIESVTRNYFTSQSLSSEKMDKLIQIEEALRLAHIMGVSTADTVRAVLRATPNVIRQDYLDNAIYNKGVVFAIEAAKIAREFGLRPPTPFGA